MSGNGLSLMKKIKKMKFSLSFLLGMLIPISAIALQPVNLEPAITFSFFRQEVKNEIGGGNVARLSDDSQFGFSGISTYALWKWVHPGLFLQVDVGQRRATTFAGFAAPGGATTNEISGLFTELWLGPLIRIPWRWFFFDAGYGALALRWDNARGDLPSSTGSASGAFSTDPLISWFVGLGGNVPLTGKLSVTLRFNYRIRYYDERGGSSLQGGVIHGTQDLTPFFGISYTFGTSPGDRT